MNLLDSRQTNASASFFNVVNPFSLSHSVPETNRKLTRVMGLPFDCIGLDDLVHDAQIQMNHSNPEYWVTPNVDIAAQASVDTRLKCIMHRARRILPDGSPVVWLSKLNRDPLQQRVTGSDLTPRLLDLCAFAGYRVALFGSDEETMDVLNTLLPEQFPGIEIVIAIVPPYGNVEDWDNARYIRALKAAKPQLLLVALGCPKQEYWIESYYREVGAPLSIGVGASLDFIAGKQIRAPQVFQKFGMEWLWRLMSNPTRLFRRYLCDFKFLGEILLSIAGKILMHMPLNDRLFDDSVNLRQNSFSVCPVIESVGNESQLSCCVDTCLVLLNEQRSVSIDMVGMHRIRRVEIGRVLKFMRTLKAAGFHCELVHVSDEVEALFEILGVSHSVTIIEDHRLSKNVA